MSTPAGWYPNPDNDGRQRYWDGVAWTEHYAPGASGQGQGPLMQFTSHIAGKNALVQIWNNRIEWQQQSRITSNRNTEMVPIRAVTSITTKRDGLLNWAVNIGVPGNVISMRVSRIEAEQVKATVQRLMLD